MSEKACAGIEIPDVFGVDYRGRSYLIECKTSKSDFYSDKRKPFRKHPMYGVGLYRYYMAPKGILKPDNMPRYWGLIEPVGKRIYTRKKPEPAPRYTANEVSLIARSAFYGHRDGHSFDYGKIVYGYYYGGMIKEEVK